MSRVSRWLIIVVALAAASGCHFLRARTGCHADQPYMHARQLPPLKVPAGLDAPSTAVSMAIPEVVNDIPARGPKDPCLEDPRPYKAAAPNKPLPQT